MKPAPMSVCCVCQLKEYDFVMDDEIEFVQALPMAGTLSVEVSCIGTCIGSSGSGSSSGGGGMKRFGYSMKVRSLPTAGGVLILLVG